MEVEEMCRKLKPVLGRKADALWHAYLLEDSQGKRELAANIEILYAKKLNQNLVDERILLIPPSKETASGKYPIGTICYNEKELYGFCLREEEVIQHCTILGRSGSGKTNTAYVIIAGLLLVEKPFLILDWKRNYRDILTLLPEKKKKEILIFTVGRDVSPLRFNPLIPPKDTPPETWLKKLIEIIAHAFYCGDGVMYLLQKAIDSVYRSFGVYDDMQEKYPVMQDVLEWLENYHAKGRETGWMTSTIRAVASLCFGEMGKVLNIRKQVGLEELLKKNVILELDSLTNNDKIFFIETLLLWIHHYRMAEPERETFKHAIIVEEAHHILLKQKQELKGGETITDIILREIRELGEAIILIDQVPSQMSNIALANSYTTIAMNLKHQADVYSTAQSMLLDTDEKKHLGRLEVGYAICKLQGRILRPFLLKIPLIRIKKGTVTDKEIRESMEKNNSFFRDVEPDRENKAGGKEKARQMDSSYSSFSRKETQKREIEVFTDFSAQDKLNENEKQLLVDVVKYQTGTDSRYERLGFNPRLGNALKHALTNKGLISVESIPTSNARVKIMSLTDKGKWVLKRLGYKTESRKNGTKHRYWKERVADYYKDHGYEVDIEKDDVDIVVKKDDGKTAIEIETGKSNTVWNIKRDLGLGFEDIVVVATSRIIEEKIIQRIRKEGLEKDKRVKVVNTNGYQ